MDVEVNYKEYHFDLKKTLMDSATIFAGYSVYTVSKVVFDTVSLCAPNQATKAVVKIGGRLIGIAAGFETASGVNTIIKAFDKAFCEQLNKRMAEQKDDIDGDAENRKEES